MSVNFDSHGGSPLGAFLESVLHERRKSITPTQKHIGTADINQPLVGIGLSLMRKHLFQIGQSIYILVKSEATIPSLGFLSEVPGYIRMSLDLASVEDVRLGAFDGASPRYRDAMVIGGVIYVQLYENDLGGSVEVTLNTSTNKWAVHEFYDELQSGEITHAFDAGGSIAHHSTLINNLDLDPGFLSSNPNGTITKVNGYSHTPKFESVGCASDGANYFMVGAFSGDTTSIVVAKISSNFSVLQVIKYSLPAGAGVISNRDGPYAIAGGVLFIFIRRTVSFLSPETPVWLGIDTVDISNVLWSKSSKKQTANISIGSNDTATTYRITISGQQEQVTGNVIGASDTATDLKNQCAASAQSNFTARTWSVAGATVTGTANHAGITWETIATAIGGTGTITKADNKNINPITFQGATAFSDDIIVVGRDTAENYGIVNIKSADGAVLSAALSNESSEGGENVRSVTTLGADIYLVGTSGSPANRFGGFQDLDLEVIPFDALPSNTSIPTDDVIWSVSAESLTRTEITTGFATISDTQTDLESPNEAFQTADSNYTF